MNRLHGRVKFVDLDNVKAERIYDLVGLMDAAVGMVTVDTSTLHLAAASCRPYVALTVGGWNTSVPKGNCALRMDYGEVLGRVEEIGSMVESWV